MKLRSLSESPRQLRITNPLRRFARSIALISSLTAAACGGQLDATRSGNNDQQGADADGGSPSYVKYDGASGGADAGGSENPLPQYEVCTTPNEPDPRGDFDGDGVENCGDLCPEDATADPYGDSDDDGIPNGWEDADGDGLPAQCDILPGYYNPQQTDADGDGVADPTSTNTEELMEAQARGADNCPDVWNPEQANVDGDLAGAACDCDDDEATVNPYAPDVACDNEDKNCDGAGGNPTYNAVGDGTATIPGEPACECLIGDTRPHNANGNSNAPCTTGIDTCVAIDATGSAFVETTPEVMPGDTDLCAADGRGDGIDQNCNGTPDEGCAP